MELLNISEFDKENITKLLLLPKSKRARGLMQTLLQDLYVFLSNNTTKVIL